MEQDQNLISTMNHTDPPPKNPVFFNNTLESCPFHHNTINIFCLATSYKVYANMEYQIEVFFFFFLLALRVGIKEEFGFLHETE